MFNLLVSIFGVFFAIETFAKYTKYKDVKNPSMKFVEWCAKQAADVFEAIRQQAAKANEEKEKKE